MYIYLQVEEEEEEDGVRIAFDSPAPLQEGEKPNLGGGKKPLERPSSATGSSIRIRLLFISRSLRHNSSISCKIHAIDSLRHPAMRACVH
jgi:hypothetical protein